MVGTVTVTPVWGEVLVGTVTVTSVWGEVLVGTVTVTSVRTSLSTVLVL